MIIHSYIIMRVQSNRIGGIINSEVIISSIFFCLVLDFTTFFKYPSSMIIILESSLVIEAILSKAFHCFYVTDHLHLSLFNRLLKSFRFIC